MINKLRARVLFYFAKARAGQRCRLNYARATVLFEWGQLGADEGSLSQDNVDEVLCLLPDSVSWDTSSIGFWVEYKPEEDDASLSKLDREAHEVFSYWWQKQGASARIKPTDKRLGKIRARLQEKFTVEELKTVVDRGFASEWWTQRGLTEVKHLFKDQETCNRFLSMRLEQKSEVVEERLTDIQRQQAARQGRFTRRLRDGDS